MMTRVVLGGGLSGLSAAYYHLKRFPSEKLILLESGRRTGGWISTKKTSSGTLFECGPRTIRPKGPAAANTLELIEELGLENEILPIKYDHPAAKNRMIYVNGELCKLPSSLFSLFKKLPPFDKPLIFHLCRDVWAPSKPSPINDESIYDFVDRRFGRDVADYLISPMICGICAGNAKEISVKFLMESMYNYEQSHGSISRGLAKSLFERKKKPLLVNSKFAEKVTKEHWSIYYFKDGMEKLPKTLTTFVQDKGTEIVLNTSCKSLQFHKDKIILQTENKNYESNHVFACVPAKILASLLDQQHPHLSSLLNTITMVDVAIINLKFNGNFISEHAFGYLIPPKEQIPILGVIYDSCCRSEEDGTILTVMLGGYWFEKYLGKNPSTDELLKLSLSHLQKSLNINEKPVDVNVNILRNCIPQYTIGHKTRVNEINNYINDNKLPISLCGASYYGVGVNDVILSARNAIELLQL